MSYSSNLETGGQRFLSVCLQQAISEAWLKPEDFTNEFSPEIVMTALERAPDLRTRLLIEAAGVHERIAPKKSTPAAVEDLRIALAEGVCTPSLLIDLFGMDDRVRYLDTAALFGLLIRDKFFETKTERARARMEFTLRTALDQDLIRLADLVDAVTPAQLAKDLPKPLLERVLTRAIESGRLDSALSPEALLEVLPLSDWVDHVALDLLWNRVIVDRVLPVTGWVAFPRQSSPPAMAPSPKEAAPESQKKQSAKAESQKASARESVEDAARTRAIDNLRKVDRLPVNVDTLATPLLLAIDGMYAELLIATDEEERGHIIRDAFPNASMLEEALYVMAQSLDPRLNRETLAARGATGESLITLVLFEEKRRQSGRSPSDRSTPSRPPGPVVASEAAVSSAPPPPASGQVNAKGPALGPPPLPEGRRSVPPPPLPATSGRGRN